MYMHALIELLPTEYRPTLLLAKKVETEDFVSKPWRYMYSRPSSVCIAICPFVCLYFCPAKAKK